MAGLRNLAIGVHRQDGQTNIARDTILAERSWGLGVDLADKPRRLHGAMIDTVRDVVDGWVTPDSDIYVEVANSIADRSPSAAARCEAPPTQAQSPDRGGHDPFNRPLDLLGIA
ncbi:hypothetical protein [Streptomyces mirabilis]|jgi:hypothetical protein|uniref:Uncharacterized protein n=1 Tax=Streptomyces mirabilis TaxID=68239 RepID=A0A1I2KHH1_9ACTN|nr:hypothetical protein [Streptomyces mirabilis]SFF65798.1 hypothetical protein SAMN02787118_110114 [Streptomyces mirabilis]